jgi:hypothetical protein
MKFVIAILGLLGTLSAQVVCRPVNSKGSLDSLFETKTIAATDLSQRFTDYLLHPVRCFEHASGTLALDGKIIHDWWFEIEPVEPFRPDVLFCPTLQSKVHLLEPRTRHLEWPRRDSEVRPRIHSSDYCKPTDNWP